MEREIHKIDKILLRIGIVLLAFSLLANACSAGSSFYQVVEQNTDGTTYSTYHWRIFGSARALRAQYPDALAIEAQPAGGRGFWYWMLAASAVMVGAGAYLHRQENRAVLMWNFLEQGVEVTIQDLCDSTALERAEMPRMLALINSQPDTHYVWDRKADRIVDGRLRNRFVVLEHCRNCGAHVEAKVPLDLTLAPVCQYCGANASSEDVNRLKQEALQAIRSEQLPGKPSPFSGVMFSILLILFWPAAVGYALWKAGLLNYWWQGAGTRTLRVSS